MLSRLRETVYVFYGQFVSRSYLSQIDPVGESSLRRNGVQIFLILTIHALGCDLLIHELSQLWAHILNYQIIAIFTINVYM